MLKPQPVPAVPELTARAAHAAFPKGHRYLTLRDNLGTVFTDDMFADLFPATGRPAEAPWRLALVTIVQFAEGLSDRDVADAVRDRITLRYLLGLEYDDPGFDYSILSRFRDRLVERNTEHILLDALVEATRKAGLIKERGKVRTDATHVLANVRELSRLELVGETLRYALNEIAKVAPEWLKALAPDDWYQRYAKRFEEEPYRHRRKQGPGYSSRVGRDGFLLMHAVYSAEAPHGLRDLAATELLRRCWLEQFMVEEDDVRMRKGGNMPPSAERLESPYDADAHYGIKGVLTWVGYKVHVTETCDEDVPHLLVHVDTTKAALADLTRVTPIHERLKQRKLLPDEHFVDNHYVTSKLLVDSKKDYGVALVGPIKPHRKAKGFGLEKFKIDWDHEVVTCPAGKQSARWRPEVAKVDVERIRVNFVPADCRACPLNKQCSKNTERVGRALTLLPREQYEAREEVKRKQSTPEWLSNYQIRSGSEGTFSQGVSAGLRQSRFQSLKKNHLQNVALAAGMNLQRLSDWFDEIPRARTRTSRFAALKA